MNSINERSLRYGLHSIEQDDATPCLVLQYTSESAVCAELARLKHHLNAHESQTVAFWLVYGTMSDRRAVDAVVDYAAESLGFDVQPILQR